MGCIALLFVMFVYGVRVVHLSLEHAKLLSLVVLYVF
jgi:hypothetical protein